MPDATTKMEHLKGKELVWVGNIEASEEGAVVGWREFRENLREALSTIAALRERVAGLEAMERTVQQLVSRWKDGRGISDLVDALAAQPPTGGT